MSVTIKFESAKATLFISGNGEICWKDLVSYSDNTRFIVIVGDGIKCRNASNLFARFENLMGIEGFIDTSECTDFSYMYARCTSLVRPIIGLNTDNGTEFDFMHLDNHALECVTVTSTIRGQKFKYMFYGCEKLSKIVGVVVPIKFDLSSVSDIRKVRSLLENNRVNRWLI